MGVIKKRPLFSSMNIVLTGKANKIKKLAISPKGNVYRTEMTSNTYIKEILRTSYITQPRIYRHSSP